MPEQLSAIAAPEGADWLTNIAYIVVALITAGGGYLIARRQGKAKVHEPESVVLDPEDREMLSRIGHDVTELRGEVRGLRAVVDEVHLTTKILAAGKSR